MKADEYNAIMADIAQNLSDQPKVTTLLDKLRTDYGEVTATLTTAQKENEQVKKAYEDAQKYNMQLFLEKGFKSEQKTITADSEDKKKSFSSLDLSDF